VLVPAIHTEFAVLHVQKASPQGGVRIEGQTFADVQQALCAEVVVVTAEEIIDEQELRDEPERNSLPSSPCIMSAIYHTVRTPMQYLIITITTRFSSGCTTRAPRMRRLTRATGTVRVRCTGSCQLPASDRRSRTPGEPARRPGIWLPTGFKEKVRSCSPIH